MVFISTPESIPTDQEPQIVRDLLRTEALGLAPDVEIGLRSTHTSWVFLAGNDVWKVKRPVELGFLDFRTLAARQQACRDELRLNRRLAPDVYLGLVPVRLTKDGYALVGAGPIVDWAVHMRRLSDAASAQAMLARGALDARALSLLAERLVVFWREARPAAALGAPTVLSENLDENFSQVAPFVGDLIDQKSFAQVEAFQSEFLVHKWERFLIRAAEGRVREGHGDLRLEHVYFVPDVDGHPHPTVIDCIEFNERFRCADQAAEVAFLAMELEAARRPDLAAGFLARFAEASDDFGLYGVLDFYLSYRAWVRGKVAAFVARDPTTARAIGAAKEDEARRMFALARACSGEPLDRRFLIAVGGIIGSGKSTLAEGLGRALAVPVISSDRTRKLLAGSPPTERGDASLYDDESRARIYVEIFKRASAVLASGRGAILDATFASRHWRQMAGATARALGAEFVFLEARCARPEVLLERLGRRRRGPHVSDATEAQLGRSLQTYEPIGETDPGPHHAVDTAGSAASVLQETLGCLAGAGISAAAERRAS